MSRLIPLAHEVRHAIARRQPHELQRLLAEHGLVPFAGALAQWSPRVVADAISQLPSDARAPVLHHLPRALRDQAPAGRPAV